MNNTQLLNKLLHTLSNTYIEPWQWGDSKINYIEPWQWGGSKIDNDKYTPTWPAEVPIIPPHDPEGVAKYKKIIDNLTQPPIEITDRVRWVTTAKELIAEFDLPGCDKKNIDVDIKNNVIYVKASRKILTKSGTKEETINRSVTMEKNIKYTVNDASCTYNDGVLRVTVPIIESSNSKKLEIT